MRYLKLVILVFSLGVSVPADAETASQQWKLCASQIVDQDLSIRACTSRIQSGQEAKINLIKLYYNRGLAYSNKWDDDRAIADYNEALRLDPKFTFAYNNRGRTYWAKGDNDRAIADFNEALRLDPIFTLAYNNRGNAYGAKGDNDRAIADFNEALRLDPKFTFAYFNRGRAYRAKGDDDRAIADYNEALRLDPKDSLAYFNRGNAYWAKGDNDRAIADYNEALRLDPKYSHTYLHRGWAYFYRGKFAEALADFNQASELDPSNAYSALYLDIAGQRNALESRLPQATSKLDMTKWPAAAVRMFLGQLTPDAMLVAADDPDEIKKKGQVCGANFFAGELALRQGEKSRAIGLFHVSARDCPRTFIERFAARDELKLLGEERP